MKQPAATNPSTHPLITNAMQFHHAGRLAEAEALYRKILVREKDNADAWHLIGVIALQTGRASDARESIGRALQLSPTNAEFHLNLGLAERALSALPAAQRSMQASLAIAPDFAQAHFHLATVHFAQGDLGAAAKHYRSAITLNPKYAEAHNNLGNVYKQQGDLDAAKRCYEKTLGLSPQHASSHNNLANIHHLQGNLRTAKAHFNQALEARPKDHAIRNNFANLQVEIGEIADAIKNYELVIGHFSTSPQAWYNYGNALLAGDRLQNAADAFKRAIQYDAAQPQFHNNLGIAYFRQDQLAAAETCFRAALDHDSGYFEALDNLTDTVLKQCDWEPLQGLTEQLLAPLRQSRDEYQSVPRPFLVTRLPFPIGAEERLRVGQAMTRMRVGSGHEAPTPAHQPLTALDQVPLRVGYISTDFNNHATSHLIHGLFGHHDRTQFEIFCYSIGSSDDSAYRNEIMTTCDQFRDLRYATTTELAATISADNIAILVDLNGYTAANRIELFALRPAPVQITYLGFPGTTGAPFFDYIIGDRFVTPADQQPYFSEQFITLPNSYQVNSPRPEHADAGDRTACGLPASGFVFCCFNNHYKIEPKIFKAWAEILAAVPDSVLWLLAGPDETQKKLLSAAAAHGLGPNRLVFAPRLPTAEHLARHRHAQLFLDTYYYNAHTTASDALWSGVPLITCPGESFTSRVGLSLVSACGMDELAVEDIAAYKAAAIKLATQPKALNALKSKLLRNRDSCPLFDTQSFAAALERAYKAIWQRRLNNDPAVPITVTETDAYPSAST